MVGTLCGGDGLWRGHFVEGRFVGGRIVEGTLCGGTLCRGSGSVGPRVKSENSSFQEKPCHAVTMERPVNKR